MGCCRSIIESLPRRSGDKSKIRGISKASLLRYSQKCMKNMYRYEQVLGTGSFGTVYLATQVHSGIQYAIKEIKKADLDQREQKLIMEEVLLLKDLDNPHIMRVHEVIETSQSIYIVTEYLGGGEVFSKITKGEHFTETLAFQYLKQILLALKYLHSSGIVHRDLKPQNLIFLSNDEESPLKVIDFGISTKIAANQKLSDSIGTILYMAPEMFKEEYDEKCDIWSAGVIMYLMLTGRPPFECKREDILRDLILKNRVNFKGQEWTDVSEEARCLVKKMLTYNPAQRPSADKLLQEYWAESPFERLHSLDPVIERLRNFQVRSTFEKAVLLYISNNLTGNKEEQKFIKHFNQIDTNNDGQISKDEIENAAGTDISGVMSQCDLDHDGIIEYSEFIAIAKDWNHDYVEIQLKQAFDEYDFNHSGALSLEEISIALPVLNTSEIKNFIAEVDKNGDSLVSFEEFKGYILNSF